MQKSGPKSPQVLFSRGQFEAVVALGLRDRSPAPQGDDWAYVAAALAATGRFPEAEAFLRAVEGQVSPGAEAFAWYHVYPGLSAKGRRSVFARLRRAAPFYAFHALARLRFASGRLSKALDLADRGTLVRKSAFDPLHAALQDAELRLHLHGMRGELALAEAAFAAAGRPPRLAVSRALYQARHGGGEDALKAVEPDGPAAGASIELERGRLQIVAGNLDAAQRTLTRAAGLLEPLDLPRFDRMLGLRRIDVLLARRALPEALVQIRLLEAGTDVAQEAVAALEITSRKLVCLKALGRNDDLARSARMFSQLRRHTGYVVPAHPTPQARELQAAALNARQLTFVEELAPGVFASVHDYRARFDVSEITACRDLAGLVTQGMIERRGKARATRYSVKSRA